MIDGAGIGRAKWQNGAIVSGVLASGVLAAAVFLHSLSTGTFHRGSAAGATHAAGCDVGTSEPARAEVVLWAWERPEDFRFLAPPANAGEAPTIGIAPLVGTLRVSAAGILSSGRRQPLIVPRGSEITAVVRIEVLPSDPPRLDGAEGGDLIEGLIERMLAWLPEPEPRALQIDFDARRSERTFYRQLLHRLRAELPAEIELEITALASWCVGDPWLRDLPIDDAVPMFFRMGRDDAPVRRRLAEGRALSLEICRQSIGVSMDEAWPRELLERPSARGGQRRLFVFDPEPWDSVAFRRVRALTGASP